MPLNKGSFRCSSFKSLCSTLIWKSDITFCLIIFSSGLMSFCFGILCTMFLTGDLPANSGFEGLGLSCIESGTMYS